MTTGTRKTTGIYRRPSVRKDPETGERVETGDGRWAYRFEVYVNGKRRTISKSGFERKGDAIAALAEARSKWNAGGRHVEPAKMLVRDFLLDEWLPAISAEVKPSTLARYTDIATRYVAPRIGGVRLDRLSAGDIGRMYQDLRESGSTRKDKDGNPLGLSEQTLRHAHNCLSAAMRHAVERRLLARNPCADIKPPKPAPPEVTAWTPEEARAFLAAIADDRLAPLFGLALATGLRKGELLGLRWIDVDLEARVLSVQHTRVKVGTRVVVGPPKNNRGRTVELDEATVATLRRWRRRQLEDRMAWGEAWVDSGYVFTREDGSELHPDYLANRWTRLLRKSKVRRIRFHDLRHTHATLALRAGAPAKVMQERLGHHSSAITLDLYSHAMPGMQRQAAEAVSALLAVDA